MFYSDLFTANPQRANYTPHAVNKYQFVPASPKKRDPSKKTQKLPGMAKQTRYEHPGFVPLK